MPVTRQKLAYVGWVAVSSTTTSFVCGACATLLRLNAWEHSVVLFGFAHVGFLSRFLSTIAVKYVHVLLKARTCFVG